jgi:hypothetical protein
VRQKSDQTKKSAQPTAAKGSNTARVKAATYDGTSSWLDYKPHFDACSISTSILSTSVVYL